MLVMCTKRGKMGADSSSTVRQQNLKCYSKSSVENYWIFS